MECYLFKKNMAVNYEADLNISLVYDRQLKTLKQLLFVIIRF